MGDRCNWKIDSVSVGRRTVEHPLVVKSSKFIGREVVGLDPGPYVFSMDSLLDLVQWLSREHPVDTDIVAKVGEEGVLSPTTQ